jgi:ribosomal protein L29
MLNVSDLQLKSVTELHELLATKREELRALRFSVSENQQKNVRAIRNTRHDIARILGTINASRVTLPKV